jgi:hypothetical protein
MKHMVADAAVLYVVDLQCADATPLAATGSAQALFSLGVPQRLTEEGAGGLARMLTRKAKISSLTASRSAAQGLPRDWAVLSRAHGLQHFAAAPLLQGGLPVGALLLASESTGRVAQGCLAGKRKGSTKSNSYTADAFHTHPASSPLRHMSPGSSPPPQWHPSALAAAASSISLLIQASPHQHAPQLGQQSARAHCRVGATEHHVGPGPSPCAVAPCVLHMRGSRRTSHRG